MAPEVSLWPLIGGAVIVAGFILRLNPMIAARRDHGHDSDHHVPAAQTMMPKP